MLHPVEARTINDLGPDFLIDWVRTWLLQRPTDPGYIAAFVVRVVQADDPRALLRTVREDLTALARLSGDELLRDDLQSLLRALPNTLPEDMEIGRILAPATACLRTSLMRREAAMPYRFDQPLEAQLTGDSMSMLRTLALIRHCLAAKGTIPLAAPLRPRRLPSINTADDSDPGAITIVEIGDLGDPLCRSGHQRVRAALARNGVRIAWSWVYFASVEHWQDSERVGAMLEVVLSLAPTKFWRTVDRLCETSSYGAERTITAILAESNVDAAQLTQRLDDERHYAGLRYDRQMALACGLPCARPLFVIERTLFTGLDTAPAMIEFINRKGRAS